MKIGFALPNIGPLGSAEAVKKVAIRAEELGYDSLWTIERLLYPVKPQTPYPVSPDGLMPESYRHSLDPLETLTFAAAHTTKIGLGTSVIDIPYYNPVMLARSLSTLDVLSGGRLKLGMGLGWLQDEFDAVGASREKLGRRADEFLQVLKAIWTTNPVEFEGEFYRVPKSFINPKPIQKPHPPIYLAAFAPAALRRVARMADGWHPVAVPVEGMKEMFDGVKKMASAEGRDPSALQLVVRANIEITEKPIEGQRMIFTGSLDQIKEDLRGSKEIGAHLMIFDPTFDSGSQKLDRWMELMEQFREMA